MGSVGKDWRTRVGSVYVLTPSCARGVCVCLRVCWGVNMKRVSVRARVCVSAERAAPVRAQDQCARGTQARCEEPGGCCWMRSREDCNQAF